MAEIDGGEGGKGEGEKRYSKWTSMWDTKFKRTPAGK